MIQLKFRFCQKMLAAAAKSIREEIIIIVLATVEEAIYTCPECLMFCVSII